MANLFRHVESQFGEATDTVTRSVFTFWLAGGATWRFEAEVYMQIICIYACSAPVLRRSPEDARANRLPECSVQ